MTYSDVNPGSQFLGLYKHMADSNWLMVSLTTMPIYKNIPPKKTKQNKQKTGRDVHPPKKHKKDMYVFITITGSIPLFVDS